MPNKDKSDYPFERPYQRPTPSNPDWEKGYIPPPPPLPDYEDPKPGGGYVPPPPPPPDPPLQVPQKDD